ncbi:MAG: RHS repeat-associated core domain-containing protein [Acidobacteria bacterium]|nr:RHS repeat-associated core domain-containing protein [Acidobacteriota bacterium]
METVLSFGKTCREYDDFTGLHYYRARWYDGNLGPFISEDPIGFAGGDFNLYGYVGNGPLNRTDPSGLIDPSVYQDPTMYSSGGFANPAEFADGLDNGLDGVEQSTYSSIWVLVLGFLHCIDIGNYLIS